MTPKKLIESIIDKKDRETMFMFFLYSFLLALAKYLTDKVDVDPLWLYSGAAIVTLIIISIVKQIDAVKIEDTLEDKIREENYEIATMITNRGVIKPSKIQGVLEEISKQED